MRVESTIAAYLRERNMDREKLARRVGRPYSTVCRWLSDPSKMKVRDLQSVYKALDIPDADRRI